MPLTHRRFTVDEYHRMAEAGILTEADRVELVEGELVEMTPIGSRHVACIVRLTDVLARRAGGGPVVSVQNPLVLTDRSEPQPDIVLLRRRDALAGAWIPQEADALLVIEVADTSLEHDRDVKTPLYARAGIPEVWLVDLRADRIDVSQEPEAGHYTSRRAVTRGESVAPLAFPDVSIAVEEILG